MNNNYELLREGGRNGCSSAMLTAMFTVIAVLAARAIHIPFETIMLVIILWWVIEQA